MYNLIQHFIIIYVLCDDDRVVISNVCSRFLFRVLLQWSDGNTIIIIANRNHIVRVIRDGFSNKLKNINAWSTKS